MLNLSLGGACGVVGRGLCLTKVVGLNNYELIKLVHVHFKGITCKMDEVHESSMLLVALKLGNLHWALADTNWGGKHVATNLAQLFVYV